MGPSELRLQSMLRAMIEVIQPAIDRSQQLATDQANIMIGTLRILLDQDSKAYAFRMVELRQYAKQLRELLGLAQGGPETDACCRAAEVVLARAKPVAALPIPTQAALTDLVQATRTAVDELLQAAHADGNPAFRRAAARLVLDAGGKELVRERVWVRAAGFEAAPRALPPMEELLSFDETNDPHAG
jgi:hypothetical protein